jgi:subfamily B ATP-binding cassette protein MsbA
MSEDAGPNPDPEAPAVSRAEKLRAVRTVAGYRPATTALLVALAVAAAVLSGVGAGFILPIIELAQGGDAAADTTGILAAFVAVYDAVGVPLTLETAVGGVAVVMTARHAASFVVAYLRAALQTAYVRDLQTRAFDRALDARVGYYDRNGSDEILNAIVTQARYAGGFIKNGTRLLEAALVSAAYVALAVYLAPYLTLLTGVVLGGTTAVVRARFESGYEVGDRIAAANERVQEAVQAGTQGIRDVKLFGVAGELFDDFQDAVGTYARANVLLRRNQAAFKEIYQWVSALTVFGLLYLGLAVFGLPVSRLAVFLFAMFRLAPKVSDVNDLYYRAEGDLPHVVRMERFVDGLEAHAEAEGGDPVPAPVERVTFEDVRFTYPGADATTPVLDGVSFDIDRGEFVAFVGQSGAGKSTVVSLLTRLYDPDGGEIRADGTSIAAFDRRDWRARVSVVRQQPWIFNDSLRYNLTVGNRDATDAEIERVCEIAQVTEFMDDLPAGYDTDLGDDGVRLSGGQRQRVAIARALLKDADLLVLDEATSDLDTGLEERVHRAIERMDRDYAVVAIAHRLSTVIGADTIYTLDDGRIAEAGTHEELLAREGQYADLYARQASAGGDERATEADAVGDTSSDAGTPTTRGDGGSAER